MDIELELKERKVYIEKALDNILPKETLYPDMIFKAMRYSIFVGGKRIRPTLLLEANKLFGGKEEEAIAFACAIEMIHTYSLIHDDLPALDNDNFRRGRLTSHKAFGENIAILAGDALLNYAYEVMTEEVCKNKNPNAPMAMNYIAKAAGVKGMIAGQVVDVINEKKELEKETLDFINENKTGALIQGALKAGGVLGGANEDSIHLLDEAGKRIGIAFQIQDDILDVIGTQEELGKPLLSDEKNFKTTYVSLLGIEKSMEVVEELSKDAIDILQSFGERSKFLVELTKYLIYRNA